MEFLEYPNLIVGQFRNFLSTSDCNLLINKIKEFSFLKHEALAGNAESTYNNPVECNDQFLKEIATVANLKNQIEEACNQYCEKTKTKKVKVVQLWANKQKQHSFLMPHHHGGKSVLSGVIYLNVDELSSGIKFVPSNNVITPELGTLIIFPSHAMHGNDKPNLSNERIIISFNTLS
jgi:hypothetical protein